MLRSGLRSVKVGSVNSADLGDASRIGVIARAGKRPINLCMTVRGSFVNL